eukprot:3822569-Amphidinium_carterae.1
MGQELLPNRVKMGGLTAVKNSGCIFESARALFISLPPQPSGSDPGQSKPRLFRNKSTTNDNHDHTKQKEN